MISDGDDGDIERDNGDDGTDCDGTDGDDDKSVNAKRVTDERRNGGNEGRRGGLIKARGIGKAPNDLGVLGGDAANKGTGGATTTRVDDDGV